MLEVACFNVASAIIAAKNGASRIELCKDQSAGGTTPPLEWLRQVKDQVSIPIFVMIRPRGGSFEYTDEEFAHMQDQVKEFKTVADGLVFGVLDREQKVDLERTTQLVHLAYPKPCTFHRAFDQVLDPSAALEDVVNAGCKAILSSGGQTNALEGTIVLAELIKRAQDRLVIIPGGGVRAANLARIQTVTGAAVMHSSGILSTESATSAAGLPDGAEIREMVQLLQGAQLEA